MKYRTSYPTRSGRNSAYRIYWSQNIQPIQVLTPRPSNSVMPHILTMHGREPSEDSCSYGKKERLWNLKSLFDNLPKMIHVFYKITLISVHFTNETHKISIVLTYFRAEVLWESILYYLCVTPSVMVIFALRQSFYLKSAEFKYQPEIYVCIYFVLFLLSFCVFSLKFDKSYYVFNFQEDPNETELAGNYHSLWIESLACSFKLQSNLC